MALRLYNNSSKTRFGGAETVALRLYNNSSKTRFGGAETVALRLYNNSSKTRFGLFVETGFAVQRTNNTNLSGLLKKSSDQLIGTLSPPGYGIHRFAIAVGRRF